MTYQGGFYGRLWAMWVRRNEKGGGQGPGRPTAVYETLAPPQEKAFPWRNRRLICDAWQSVSLAPSGRGLSAKLTGGECRTDPLYKRKSVRNRIKVFAGLPPLKGLGSFAAVAVSACGGASSLPEGAFY